MKRVLITGANKGIGFATVRKILSTYDDVHVFLGARNVERGDAAVDRLLAENPAWEGRVERLQIDVSDPESVNNAAERLALKYPGESHPLYGIVNNAGIGFSGTPEEVLGVNTDGVQRVCSAFIPLLKTEGGRVVNVTSASGPTFVSSCDAKRQAFFTDPEITWSMIQSVMKEYLDVCNGAGDFTAKGLGSSAYGMSKACANGITLCLARENPSLRINACTPGFIETDLTRPYATSSGKTPEEMGMKPPEQGTASTLYLLMGEPEGNGRYYGSDAVRSPLDRYRSPGDPPYTGE
jgi:NAD(P)-dependent dehydrogenase (short-subunit alcohol dehydrogenase family)